MKKSAQYIWMNGKTVPFDAAKIHVLNHSLHYGSAVFEGIRCYKTSDGPAIFRLTEHINRLFYSAKVIGLAIPYNKSELKKAITGLIKKNNFSECYIRPIIFYGEKMGLMPDPMQINVTIAVWPWGKYLKKDAVAVKISRFMRIHPRTSDMNAKLSGHYTNSILASQEAHKSGYDEALLLDHKGFIAEGPGENIFFVKGDVLYTPKKGAILPGITRSSVFAIAKKLSYKVIEKNILRTEIKKFDEAFFCGTAAEINAIGKIDKVKIGNGREGTVTKQIKNYYKSVTHGEIKEFKKWLSYVK